MELSCAAELGLKCHDGARRRHFLGVSSGDSFSGLLCLRFLHCSQRPARLHDPGHFVRGDDLGVATFLDRQEMIVAGDDVVCLGFHGHSNTRLSAGASAIKSSLRVGSIHWANEAISERMFWESQTESPNLDLISTASSSASIS
jgi:hypothetical protein